MTGLWVHIALPISGKRNSEGFFYEECRSSDGYQEPAANVETALDGTFFIFGSPAYINGLLVIIGTTKHCGCYGPPYTRLKRRGFNHCE